MDDAYRDIFETMYTRRPPLEPDAEREYPSLLIYPPGREESVVRRTIDEVDAGLFESRRLRLRADAKYFLLLNFVQMVLAPVRLRGRRGNPELTSSLVDDINLIVNEAARQQQIRERDAARQGLASEQYYLSGHAVLEAVANNWGNLKLNSFRIWGED